MLCCVQGLLCCVQRCDVLRPAAFIFAVMWQLGGGYGLFGGFVYTVVFFLFSIRPVGRGTHAIWKVFCPKSQERKIYQTGVGVFFFIANLKKMRPLV